MSTVLWINEVAMPTPSKLTSSKEPIWSSNAGRASTGLMVGDIIGYKFKLQIEWKVLSQNASAALNKAITTTPFFSVKFIDPTSATGEFRTITAYASAPSYPVYSYVQGLPRHTGVGVNLIEQ